MRCLMKRLAVRFLLLFAAFLVLAAAAPLLFADSSVRIVRLSYVDGDVQIDQRDGQGFETAYMNMPVTPGTRIQTRADSRAEIELEDGSTIRLAPNSLVEFTSMGLRSDGSRDTMVDLEGGTAYVDLHHHRDDDFRLNFAHETITLHHSVRFRASLDDGHAVIVPIKGDLEVLNENGNTLDVRRGETLTIDLTDPDHFYRANTAESGPVDAWDQEREDYRDSYVDRNNYNSYQTTYQNAGYSYGYPDLNYYGAYTYVPGWGWMWQPYYMPMGWNPYMDGAWAFYPGFGWQWVSAYPWGWVPYHYGGWYYVGGYGWCWQPGPTIFWNPAPVVVNGPPHFNAPAPPPVPGPQPPHRPGIPPLPRPSPRVVAVGRGPITIFPPGDKNIPHRVIDVNHPDGNNNTYVTPGAPTTTNPPANKSVVITTPPGMRRTVPMTPTGTTTTTTTTTTPPRTVVQPPSTSVTPTPRVYTPPAPAPRPVTPPPTNSTTVSRPSTPPPSTSTTVSRPSPPPSPPSPPPQRSTGGGTKTDHPR